VLGIKMKEARFCTGGCNTVRTSIEPHVCLTLEVTKGTLGNALDQLSAWEDVSDYECDMCKVRTTLRKRNSVDSLGHTLVLHLKRFEMNYDTGQTAKLNNRFEFPEELDLWPVSYECLTQQQQQQQPSGGGGPAPPSRPREYYQYDLVGVVVHTGTLESGHYYSFIKERGPRAAARAAARPEGGANGRWLEFNDSVVSEFDSSRIPSECFGGVQTVSQWNAALKSHIDIELPVVKSAYMLVYERRAAQPIEVMPQMVPHLSPAQGGCALSGDRLLRDNEPTKRARTDAPSAASPPSAASVSAAANASTIFVLPHELVPTDPATARGFLPASIVQDVLADNVAFVHQCQQVDPDVAALWHLLLDAVARQPALLQRGLGLPSLQYPPPARGTPASALFPSSHALCLSTASFVGAPCWLPDFSLAGFSDNKLDIATLVRAGTLFCFYPLLKSTHVDLVSEDAAPPLLVSLSFAAMNAFPRPLPCRSRTLHTHWPAWSASTQRLLQVCSLGR
jgi:hypothetical protein